MSGQLDDRGTSEMSKGEIEQWATRVITVSSQYDSVGWAAESVLGMPKVYPRYGDITGSWAQGVLDSKQYIELEFDTSVYVSAINIYENLNCGGVKQVSVRSPQGTWDKVWGTEKVEHITNSRIFSPEIKKPTFRTRAVRLDIDCSVSNSWVEIDAVQLVGRRVKVDAVEPLSILAADLKTLVNDLSTCDVVLKANNGAIYAHRAILSVRSQTFKDKIEKTKKNDPIQMEEFSSQALLGVMHYIYSGSIPTNYSPTLLTDVWRAAAVLDLPDLQSLCVWLIDERMNVQNVISTFTHSTDHEPKSEAIKDICTEFIAANLSTVSLNAEFKYLPQHLMLEIIQQAASKLTV